MTRNGDWMQTFTGKQYWPIDPRPGDVCIDDIAHALSNACRYAGHCNDFYSVAEHSVYVSLIVPHDLALKALLHDATEAYCVDVPRPLKRFLPGYAEIEQRNWLAIAEHFGLTPEMPQCIKDADNACLLAEKARIMGPEPATWQPMDLPGGLAQRAGEVMDCARTICATPFSARIRFMKRYRSLTT